MFKERVCFQQTLPFKYDIVKKLNVEKKTGITVLLQDSDLFKFIMAYMCTYNKKDSLCI